MAELQDVTKRAREQHALVFEGLMAQLGSLKTAHAGGGGFALPTGQAVERH